MKKTKKLEEAELAQLRLLAVVVDKEQESLRFAQYRSQVAQQELQAYLSAISVKYGISAVGNINVETGEIVEEESETKTDEKQNAGNPG